MAFQIEAACFCNKGRIRKNNEDNFFLGGQCLQAENDGLSVPVVLRESLCSGTLLSVFDGMGGEENGEIAAFIAAESMQKIAQRRKSLWQGTQTYLQQLCERINENVFCAASELNSPYMGTTMVSLYVWKEKIYSINVGDSRAYRLRDDELIQLSRDHKSFREVIRGGEKRRRYFLTQYMGMDPEEVRIAPHITRSDLRKGDQYLLCSDGLTDMVSDEEILELLLENNCAEDAVRCLVQAALDHGGKDNVTVIVCRIS